MLDPRFTATWGQKRQQIRSRRTIKQLDGAKMSVISNSGQLTNAQFHELYEIVVVNNTVLQFEKELYQFYRTGMKRVIYIMDHSLDHIPRRCMGRPLVRWFQTGQHQNRSTNATRVWSWYWHDRQSVKTHTGWIQVLITIEYNADTNDVQISHILECIRKMGTGIRCLLYNVWIPWY